jgi:hypothetical protein
MHSRNALALAPVFSALVCMTTELPASAVDEKEACLSAADQGQSLRDDGKYSAARDQFLTCSRDLCPKLVHDQCTEWLRQLDESMPTVVFGVKDEHGNDVAAARVLVDGKVVASHLDGKPVPLDPGPHDFRFERDEPNQSVTVHAVLRTAEKNREVLAAFPAGEGEPSASPGGSNPGPAPAEKAEASSSSFWNGRTIMSLSLLVGGTVGVGTGVFFGLQSQSEKSQADSQGKTIGIGGCGAKGNSADPRCKTLSDTRDAQNRDALLSDVLYIAGGALAAGAVATWLLWPKGEKEPHGATSWVAPAIGPTHAGIRVGGAF